MRAAANASGAMLLALSLGAAGCAGSSPGLLGQAADRVRGDADGAVVAGMESRVDAYPLAIAHCARFGRSAQFVARVPSGHRFRCVAG